MGAGYTKSQLPTISQRQISRLGFGRLPRIITDAGDRASRRFIEFFVATIRNENTRLAYAYDIGMFFDWAEQRRFTLDTLDPIVVSAYIEHLCKIYAAPTVKQHLAAIRMLFDWLVTGQIVPMSPASSVRGPKHVVRVGKTPVLSADEARALLDSIDVSSVIGLRDRAIIGLMVYSFARVSATMKMRVDDYYQQGKRWWVRLHEKGGKRHQVPTHHLAEEYLDAYVEAAGIDLQDKKAPLFRTLDRQSRLTAQRLTRNDALRMIKRRAKGAGLSATTCCHTFRATGITVFIRNGGTIEKAQAIAAHDSIRSTKLYDRTGDEITLDEIERIVI